MIMLCILFVKIINYNAMLSVEMSSFISVDFTLHHDNDDNCVMLGLQKTTDII